MTSPTSAMAKSALMKKFTDRKNKTFFFVERFEI